ncbi:MAG: CRISPR-associated endonuclease Cas3'' [Deltaproteobacteria bacterium]|nr:CRISPR-associated endonuclease Cas3'' [Deltaproteobacteria bacterium]
MLPSLSRLFEAKEGTTNNVIETMILCHDVGKLSYRWQDYIHLPKEKRGKGPPHATLGGPYLFNIDNGGKQDLCYASAIAILMHHTDSGLAQGNLEHPAEDAILRGLVEYGTENIRWAEGAEEAFRRSLEFGPELAKGLEPLVLVTLSSLEDLAKVLRLWARCPREIERHRHRMQALAMHHVLKVCDWRAASHRPQQEPDEDEEGERVKEKWKQSLLSVYIDGGLMA